MLDDQVNSPLLGRPFTVANIKAAAPTFEIFRVREELCPMVTEPKAKLVGTTCISGLGGVAPVPDNDTVTDASSGSSLAMVMVPVLAPAEAGVKVTVTSPLFPAATEKEVVDTVN
jgi:hypothetical protein